MKKTMVFIVLFLVIAFMGFAEWLEAEFTFQAGWIPNGNIDFYEPNPVFIELHNPFDATFKIDAAIFHIGKIGGTCSTFFSNADGYFLNSPVNLWPTGITFLIYLGIEPIKGISINYEHSCSHPVAPFVDVTQFSGEGRLDVGYDRIYVEIKGKLSF